MPLMLFHVPSVQLLENKLAGILTSISVNGQMAEFLGFALVALPGQRLVITITPDESGSTRVVIDHEIVPDVPAEEVA